MRRRTFIMLSPAMLAGGSGKASIAPDDLEKLNRFAAEYNRYIAHLRNDVRDLKQWQRVMRAWETLN